MSGAGEALEVKRECKDNSRLPQSHCRAANVCDHLHTMPGMIREQGCFLVEVKQHPHLSCFCDSSAQLETAERACPVDVGRFLDD
jgi:hypothetical protein